MSIETDGTAPTRRAAKASSSGRSGTVARHGRQKRRGPARAILSFIGGALGVVLLSGVALAGGQYYMLQTTLNENSFVIGDPDEAAALPQIGTLEGGINMLIVGVDTRDGKNSIFGSESSELNDVNILVHISEDQSNVVVVSFPRDLIVPIPSCVDEDGDNVPAMSAQPLNNAYYYGGMNCVVSTIEGLTGLDIPYAAMTTFYGVIQMSNAVGGVEICISGGDLYDSDAKVWGEPLSLSEGKHTIKGATALAYLRSRHGVGDGSDLGRISSQQSYMSSLVRGVKDDGTLTDPAKLYSLAIAASENMSLSSSLTSPDTMIALARILSNVDLDKMAFVSYPGSTGSTQYPGKVVPNKPVADKLFAAIRADKPIEPGDAGVGQNVSGTVEASAPATDDESGEETEEEEETPTADSVTISGVRGQIGSEVTCSIANN